MTGRVISRPSPPCRCEPPYKDSEYGQVPTESVGTVWRCDDCSGVWKAYQGGWVKLAEEP